MERRKLEYLTRRVNINDLKKLYGMIDYEGIYHFNQKVAEVLKEGGTMYGILPPEDRKELDIQFMVEYMIRFEEMNQLCIKNKTAPFFLDPTNLSECEKIREDLVESRPEEELNAFFGVSSYEEYIPPLYKGEPS